MLVKITYMDGTSYLIPDVIEFSYHGESQVINKPGLYFHIVQEILPNDDGLNYDVRRIYAHDIFTLEVFNDAEI